MATQVKQGAITEELRERLEQIRAQVAAGATEEALRQIDAALQAIPRPRLLTMEEAAHVLGIRSPLIAELLLGLEGVKLTERGDEVLAELGEVERVFDSERARMTRADDKVHDMLEDFGGRTEMTEEELENLHLSRPGTLPWEREQ
jgi:hypothetical protein